MDFYKGGNLRKGGGGVDLEKRGGTTPLTNLPFFTGLYINKSKTPQYLKYLCIQSIHEFEYVFIVLALINTHFNDPMQRVSMLVVIS